MNEPFQPGFGQMELRLGYGGFLRIVASSSSSRTSPARTKLAFLDEDFRNAAGELRTEFDFWRGAFDPARTRRSAVARHPALGAAAGRAGLNV